MENKKLNKFSQNNISLHTFNDSKNVTKSLGIFSKLWNWKPTKQHKFLQQWSIHGTRYVVEPNRHILERIFWFLTVLCFTGIAIYLSYLSALKYMSSPIIISFVPTQASVSQVPFPAVTICNVNKFKKSIAIDSLKKLKETDGDLNVLEDVFLLKELDHICLAGNSFGAKFNYSLNRTTLDLQNRKEMKKFEDYFKDIKYEEIVTVARAAKFVQSFQTCGEMLHLCMWQGEEFECEKHFIQEMSDFGSCCTFNMMPSMILLNQSESDPLVQHKIKFIPKEELESWSKFNLDLDLTRYSKEPFPRRQEKAGKNGGLSFLLTPSINEYFCAGHDGFGYRIYPHSPIEIPHVLEYGLAVGPNREMFINLKAETITAEEKDIKDIDSSKRHCYFLTEKKLANYRSYTINNCIDECVMNKTREDCSCVLFDMPQSTPNKASYCQGKGYECAANIKRKLSEIGPRRFCTNSTCIPNCNSILYETQTASLPIRSDINIWKNVDSGKRMDWSNQNVSIVHIFFGSDSVYTKVRKRLFGFSELFANVGGILGLFIGFSVVSIVEPSYFLLRFATGNNPNENEEESD